MKTQTKPFFCFTKINTKISFGVPKLLLTPEVSLSPSAKNGLFCDCQYEIMN